MVDLPTPPFWFAMATIRVPGGRVEAAVPLAPCFGDAEPPDEVGDEPERAAALEPDIVTDGS